MPILTLNRKAGKAYFHSGQRLLTEDSQNIFESQFQSNHVVFNSDILAVTLPFLADETAADNYVAANPTILKKYTQFPLTELPGSNGQTWYINDGGTWMKPIMAEYLVPDPVTNAPSNGLIPKLYKASLLQIPPSTGTWEIDSYQGALICAPGQTPQDLGWGTPVITCYVYIGPRGGSGGGGGGTLEIYYNGTHVGAAEELNFNGNDLIITPVGNRVNVSIPSFLLDYTAGSATVKGQPMYQTNTGGRADLAQAHTGLTMKVIGVADDDASINTNVKLRQMGTITRSDWTPVIGTQFLTVGLPYYLSAFVPGQMSATVPTTAGQFVAQIGVAKSTTELSIQIQPPVQL